MYYAEKCNYGIRTMSDGDTLVGFTSPYTRDAWVRDDSGHRIAIDYHTACRRYGSRKVKDLNVGYEHVQVIGWDEYRHEEGRDTNGTDVWSSEFDNVEYKGMTRAQVVAELERNGWEQDDADEHDGTTGIWLSREGIDYE